MAALFCDTALAARIERAEAEFMAACAAAGRGRGADPHGFTIRVGGGVATYVEPGSPFNKVAGLGFDGPTPDAGLDAVERAYAAVGCPVQVELSILGDAALPERLTGRGYRLASFENVLGRPLTDIPSYPPNVSRSPEGELQTWLDVVVEAFLHEDVEGIASFEEFPRAILEAAERDQATSAGATRYLARRDGVPAGGALYHATGDGIAQFAGAATLPEHRRRGVQTALLAARLADAHAAGCDLAVVTTRPGSPSQRNVQRAGFELLYTRAVLILEK
ncbi:GNAT family N-acetyltransferase [Paractinoplanes globisporus]|uniref:GNAT family N-acetyltransferase n=1 Tax=Paractinoplanes globisporus TaxID=113565 RepID=A0ABW6W6P6_9ACTN|nr:GNAT family N-acetyltransferase [Actinoplanes globisporus]